MLFKSGWRRSLYQQVKDNILTGLEFQCVDSLPDQFITAGVGCKSLTWKF